MTGTIMKLKSTKKKPYQNQMLKIK